MPRQIGMESALRIASVWDSNKTLLDNMTAAGFEGAERNIRNYRRQAEELIGSSLILSDSRSPAMPRNTERIHYSDEYTAVIFSDAHFWPGEHSDSFWILLQLLEDINPRLVINNGDSLDAASISRHDPSGWNTQPTLAAEIDACREALNTIRDYSKDAEHWWNMGNHDLRFEGFLAKHAPQLSGVAGSKITDQFTGWQTSMSIWLNDSVVVKHRWHASLHGAHQNTLKSGKTFVTGHTHRLQCAPWTDYNGTRYGIETGMLSTPHGPQYDYAEANPANHRQGFVVLTMDGADVYPELVEVKNGKARFRGRVYTA